MTYSKIHKRFSERLKNPDVLKNPEKYLGPNYQDILNFWIYLDNLSEQEREEIGQRYWALDSKVRDTAMNAAWDAADEVVGEKFKSAAWLAAYDVTEWRVFGNATEELIGYQTNKTFLNSCFPNFLYKFKKLKNLQMQEFENANTIRKAYHTFCLMPLRKRFVYALSFVLFPNHTGDKIVGKILKWHEDNYKK
jgi:hypothetical protein